MQFLVIAEEVSFLMLAILFFGTVLQWNSLHSPVAKSFLFCLGAGMIALAADAVSYLIEGSGCSKWFETFIAFLSYFSTDLLLITFGLYLRIIFNRETSVHFPAYRICLVFVIADVIFLIAGCATGKLFSVSDGIFHYGTWDRFAGLLPTIGLLVCLAAVSHNKDKLRHLEFWAVVLYLMIPIISFLLVFLFGFPNIAYVSIAFSMLVIYVLFQATELEAGKMREQLLEEMTTVDVLTGLGNRRAFQIYLDTLPTDSPTGVLYCDLNGLKNANDTQGHASGDMLIRKFAELLKKSFRKGDCYRISGDEFIAVLSPIPETRFREKEADFRALVAANDDIAAIGSSFGAYSGDFTVITEAEDNMYIDKNAYYERTGRSR